MMISFMVKLNSGDEYFRTQLTAECMPKIFIYIKQIIKYSSWLRQDLCAPIAGMPAILRTAWVRRAVIAVKLLGRMNFATLPAITNL
jgi:hypothetical protein